MKKCGGWECSASAKGLTVEQLVRFGIEDFIGQPDNPFHAAPMRVIGKDAELYRRLS